MRHPVMILIVSLLLLACSSMPDSPSRHNGFPPISPDYVGVTIPAGIAPLNFYVDDDSVDCMDVVVNCAKGKSVRSNGAYADFDIDEWHTLVNENVNDSLTVTVCVRKDGEWTAYKPFPIYVSGDALGEWGVTYRLIPPGYETYGQMGLYQRDLSNFVQMPIIENRFVDSDCMNCHTPNRTNPSQFTFHIRGEHGATVVFNGEQTTILAPRNDDLGGGMVYPFWHPSGRYVAYSTNQTHQNFHQLKGRRVEVYDDKSDIIIYNPSTYELLLNSTIATNDHLENFPAFSPDGKSLYFCAAAQVDSVWKHYRDIKYNICRVDFDAESGTVGSQVDTLVNARSLGQSANMPRISYDGKWLLYTMSDYGCFPIWHPEADLWMMNLETGVSYPLEDANSDEAESFHNWSQNSRWIVFTSRRDDGLYTQLYIAHIDDNGRASKPFRLPQQNPKEYDAESVFSFNTPDFANAPIDLQQRNIYKLLRDSKRVGTSLKRHN